MRKRDPANRIMALVLLFVLAIPGIFLGLLLGPWFFLLMLLMMFAPLVFLRPERKG